MNLSIEHMKKFSIIIRRSVLLLIILPLFSFKVSTDPKPKLTTFIFQKGINISAWLAQANLSDKAKIAYFKELN